MLTDVHIRDFALVDDLRLEVGAGFSVLTGETGAGKSIIVDALSAALGERAGTEVVRTGAQRALVEAVFDVSDCPKASETAAELGFEPEDNLLILSREIARGGRSQCRINGRPATASLLRQITSRLIDIHGQHEHQSLLSVATHVDILDAWCGGEAPAVREQARGLHHELVGLQQERERLRMDERERARLVDLYGFQIKEINTASLQSGEEEELAQERNRLANAEKLYAAADEIRSALAEDGGAIDALSAASIAAERIAGMDQSAAEVVDRLNSALVNAQEALAFIRGYRDEVEANPERLEQIEERLDLIRTLKRKYGDTIEDVLEYARGLAEKLDGISGAEERLAELDGRIVELEGELESACAKLSAIRRSAAAGFENAVVKELAELAMKRTTFQVGIQPSRPGPTGADAVEFLISPNPGEPVKPLAKIASGGEMSRIMLALKTVTAKAEIPTLVFDEIDAGIGGLTAQVLGEKLASLGSKCQVMCVTHLPQVASKAAHHVAVRKTVEDGRSCVRVNILEGEDRIAELARMLGTEEVTGAAATHAREMLSVANQGTG